MIEKNGIKFYSEDELKDNPSLKKQTEIVSKDDKTKVYLTLDRTISYKKENDDLNWLVLETSITENSEDWPLIQYLSQANYIERDIKSIHEVFTKLKNKKELIGRISEFKSTYTSPFRFRINFDFDLGNMFKKPKWRVHDHKQWFSLSILGFELTLQIPWFSIYLALTGKIKKSSYSWVWK